MIRWMFGLFAALLSVQTMSEAKLPVVFMDDFSRYECGEEPPTWESLGAKWTAEKGRLRCKATGDAFSIPVKAPLAEVQTVEALVRPLSRTGMGGWALAGVCILLDGANFWRLSLVEGPEGQRYAELVEMMGGRWQAQQGLEVTALEGKGIQWEYGEDYLLRIELTRGGITGLIVEPERGKILTKIGYAFRRKVAVREGKGALSVMGMEADFDNFSVSAPESPGFKVMRIGIRAGPMGRAAIFADRSFGIDGSAARDIADSLRKGGFGVALLTAKQISNPAILNTENIELLVLPECHDLPADFVQSLLQFLRQGGNLIVCGGPMFSRMLWEQKGRWIGTDEYREAVKNVRAKHVFLSFEHESLKRWRRATNNPQCPTTLSLDEGIKGEALHVRIPELTGWDTFGISFESSPFPKGHILTCFWAKGSKNTTQMVVEWRESDGSRWLATLDLSPKWHYYVLPPEEFKYWPDSPSVGRGGPGDRFRPENASFLSFGLALSHCRKLGKGPHDFWVDEVGTAPHPLGRMPSLPRLPALEILSPSYKVYPLRETVKVELDPRQKLLSGPDELPPVEGVAPVPRMRGLGFEKGYRRRWIPVFRALDREGEDRGAAFSLLINLSALYYGSVWAELASDDPAFLRDPRTLRVISGIAKRMAEGLFLAEGGSEHFAYFQGERVVLGAKVVNFGRKAAKVEVDISVRPEGQAKPAFEKRIEALVPPMGRETVKCAWEPRRFESDVYIVKVSLVEQRRVIDEIEHEFQVVPDWRGVSRDEFVKVREGEFWLRGREWHPVGVNYWPRYVAGLEPPDYQAHWLTPSYYDPEMVDGDLRKLADLGMAMVSVSIGSREQIRNLHDFLLRCRRYGIKVNLFVGGLDPLLGDGSGGIELIKEARLPDNPVVFAYDIAWEPNLTAYDRGKYGGWRRFDAQWRRWILEQYGSIEEAEKEWDFPARRINGQIVGPSTEQVRTDGPWRRMVAVYRRFIYDVLGERYCKVVRRIKEADPNHLVSFRGSSSFTPEWRGFWPIQSPGVIRCIDFLSPEGYHLLRVDSPTPWEDMLRGGFITLYHHFVSQGKPVFWAEFGGPIYPNGTAWKQRMFDEPGERLEYQSEEIGRFVEMFLRSGAQGWAIWWFPGGYRVNEGSDWGIFNPDGSERPVCQVLRRLILRFRGRPRRGRKFIITLDSFIYPQKAWKDYSYRYLEAIEAEKSVDLRTEGTGKTSLDVPLICVGGLPYRGNGPLQFLNAMFDWVKVKARRSWKEVEDGSEVPLTPDGVLVLEAQLGNTGETKWICPANTGGRKGAVYLGVFINGRLAEKIPVFSDVPYLGSITVGPFKTPHLRSGDKVALRVLADGRAVFGRRFDLTVR